MAKRIWAKVSDETFRKIKAWSIKLGMGDSQLTGMAVQAGLDALLRVYSPLEGIPPEQIAKIASAMKAEGFHAEDIETFTGGKPVVKVNRGTTARKTAKAKSH